jgi:Activator of Hsp90 ATPase homolog 1-like protein
VLKWRNELRPELKAEGYARCMIEVEPVSGAVKLTITHTMDRAGSKLIEAVSGGWPRILSNLKSLLETGQIVLKA